MHDKKSSQAPILAISPGGHPPESKYERLIAKAKEVPAATTMVVHPCDETSLRGALRQATKSAPDLFGGLTEPEIYQGVFALDARIADFG